MNDFYYRVTVATVCTALSFVLGANKEAKAATITLTPTTQFGVHTTFNRLNFRRSELSSSYNRVSSGLDIRTRLAEFNISSFFVAPNTIISSAIFQDKISSIGGLRPVTLGISGYVGNGIAEASDPWGQEVFLSSVDISSSSPGDTLSFDVTTFVNQRASNGNTFVGFAINISTWGGATLGGTDALGRSSLVIETVDAAEPVPEPTTIFGSALALSLGGWLKRKNSSRQDKTTSQR